MKSKILALLLFFTYGLLLVAREVKVVEGTYTYVVPPTMSYQEGKQEALRRAQLNALAKAFGRIIAESSTSVVNGQDELFYQEGNTQVKGEWLETIGTPEFERSFSDDGIIIKCTVKGRAREIKSVQTQLNCKVLCSQSETAIEQLDFCSGNRIYLSFIAAENGYLAVYLYDSKADEVSCLLPYPTDVNSACSVKGDYSYLLFSKAHNEMPGRAVEYVMNCTDEVEVNTLYIVFSKREFAKPTLDRSSQIGHLSYADFQRWLVKSQSNDESMQVVKKNLRIFLKK